MIDKSKKEGKMNKQDLIFKLIEMLISGDTKTEVAPPKEKHLIGEWVIVRCRDAGVHFGRLVNYEGREVTLERSRRMWYWFSAEGHTLSGCAVHGVKQDKSKIAAQVKTIILPEACEIIYCEEKAINSIGECDEYYP